jgi:hypothetical protein
VIYSSSADVKAVLHLTAEKQNWMMVKHHHDHHSQLSDSCSLPILVPPNNAVDLSDEAPRFRMQPMRLGGLTALFQVREPGHFPARASHVPISKEEVLEFVGPAKGRPNRCSHNKGIAREDAEGDGVLAGKLRLRSPRVFSVSAARAVAYQTVIPRYRDLLHPKSNSYMRLPFPFVLRSCTKDLESASSMQLPYDSGGSVRCHERGEVFSRTITRRSIGTLMPRAIIVVGSISWPVSHGESYTERCIPAIGNRFQITEEAEVLTRRSVQPDTIGVIQSPLLVQSDPQRHQYVDRGSYRQISRLQSKLSAHFPAVVWTPTQQCRYLW